jgi:hypothetical protein
MCKTTARWKNENEQKGAHKMTWLSNHARLRMAQRNLTLEEINYVKCYGVKVNRAGALIHYLRKRDVPEWDLLAPKWARLIGTAVIQTKDGRLVITAWRDKKKGLRKIKKKPKNDLMPKTWSD